MTLWKNFHKVYLQGVGKTPNHLASVARPWGKIPEGARAVTANLPQAVTDNQPIRTMQKAAKMSRRNLLKSQIVSALMKVEAQVEKEAAERVGGRPKKDDEKPTSNLTEVFEKPKDRAPETAEIMARKAGFRSKNTWKDAKLIVTESPRGTGGRSVERGKIIPCVWNMYGNP